MFLDEVKYPLERRECFHINRNITVVNLFSEAQWPWYQSMDFWLHCRYCTSFSDELWYGHQCIVHSL